MSAFERTLKYQLVSYRITTVVCLSRRAPTSHCSDSCRGAAKCSQGSIDRAGEARPFNLLIKAAVGEDASAAVVGRT